MRATGVPTSCDALLDEVVEEVGDAAHDGLGLARGARLGAHDALPIVSPMAARRTVMS